MSNNTDIIELFNWNIKNELFDINNKIIKFSNDDENVIKIKNDVTKWLINSYKYTYVMDKINNTITKKSYTKYKINFMNDTIKIIINILTYIFYTIKTCLINHYHLYQTVDAIQIKLILDNAIHDIYVTFIYKSQHYNDIIAFEYIYTLYKYLHNYEKICRMLLICKHKSQTKIIKDFTELLTNVMDYIQSNNLLLIDDSDNIKNETDLYNENIIKRSKKSKKKERIKNEKINEHLKEIKYEENELSKLNTEIENLKNTEINEQIKLNKLQTEYEQSCMFLNEQYTRLYNDFVIYNNYIEFQEEQIQKIKNTLKIRKYNILRAAEQIEINNDIKYDIKCLHKSKSCYL